MLSGDIFVPWNSGYYFEDPQVYSYSSSGRRQHMSGAVEWFEGGVFNDGHHYAVARYHYGLSEKIQVFDNSVDEFLSFLKTDAPELKPLNYPGGLFDAFSGVKNKENKGLDDLNEFRYRTAMEKYFILLNSKYYEVSRRIPYDKTQFGDYLVEWIRLDIVQDGEFKNKCLIFSVKE